MEESLAWALVRAFDGRFDLQVFVSLVLWQLVLLYTVPVGYWLFEVALVAKKWLTYEPPSETVPLSAVTVKILTVDDAAVVQRTVDALPPELDDVYVVAERDIDVEGATVLVVPSEFSCIATDKGRALEWARREHPTDREYVLYLDEDTVVPDIEPFPAADVVQFRERPVRTGSRMAYLAEVHRIGFNVEQLAFPLLRFPLYAWGGGIAVRQSVEDAVTWDVDTIVEDSVFVWRARRDLGATYHVEDRFFENQAPPSVRSMLSQRRRWLTGTRQRTSLLPLDYQVLYQMRDVGWSVSTSGPLVWGWSLLAHFQVVPFGPQVTLLGRVYLGLSVLLLAFVYLWSAVGLAIYRPSVLDAVVLLAFTPVVVFVHSIGALVGIVAPSEGFAVTAKVAPQEPRPGEE